MVKRINPDGSIIEVREKTAPVKSKMGGQTRTLHRQRQRGDYFTVDESTDCWIWNGKPDKDGYGRIGNQYAHRWFFRKTVKPLSRNECLIHTCNLRICINPHHMEVVKRAQMMAQCARRNAFSNPRTKRVLKTEAEELEMFKLRRNDPERWSLNALAIRYQTSTKTISRRLCELEQKYCDDTIDKDLLEPEKQ